MDLAGRPGADVGAVLLDVPSFAPDGTLRMGGSVENLLAQLPPDVTVCGGNLDHPALDNYRCIDFLKDAQYQAENAYITAECAVEIALSAAAGIAGLKHVAVFSIGSDGTDGPTDAAGGYADGRTAQRLSGLGLSIDSVLADNDAYHALARVGGLIFTGPTGTNVNDVAVVLIHPQL